MSVANTVPACLIQHVLRNGLFALSKSFWPAYPKSQYCGTNPRNEPLVTHLKTPSMITSPNPNVWQVFIIIAKRMPRKHLIWLAVLLCIFLVFFYGLPLTSFDMPRSGDRFSGMFPSALSALFFSSPLPQTARRGTCLKTKNHSAEGEPSTLSGL